MNKPLKMGLVVISITSALEADGFNNLTPTMWNWIAVAVLTLLFFILLISIIRDIKNNKKRINSILVKNKCELNANNNYINDINTNRTENTLNLKNNIKELEEDTTPINIKKLEETYKEIYLNNKEEEIFLKVTADIDKSTTKEFKLRELLSHLKEYNIVKQPGIITSNHNLVANEEIISDIFFLLSKHQTAEHSYKEPKFDVELNENSNNLIIKIARNLKLNRHINQVFLNSIEPTYSNISKKYYGIYLYLIKRLVDKINAKLIINSNKEEESYNVSVSIPVDIRYEQVVSSKPNMVLKTTKKALVISDEESAYKLSEYLKTLNFDVDKKYTEKTNKEIPNFMDYDIAFVDSKLFEPILTEYLQTIKKYSSLKVVAVLSEKNRLYPSILVDETIDIDKVDANLYNKIGLIYNKDMVEKSDASKEKSKPIVSNYKKPLRKGRVLIADDDKTNLHILEFMLKKYSIEVTSCNDGQEVLDKLKESGFDLIILDSVMPRLDGYQTIKKIRENEKYNSIPVVIHTSFSLKKSSMSNIFKLGFDSYLPKPFNKKDLESLLERYVKISKLKQKDKTIDKDSLKEFIAIYSESDKMLERYIKEKRDAQALALIKDLQTISSKIDANDFVNSLDSIKDAIKNNGNLDDSLIYSMSDKLKELKSNIMKSLSA